MSETITAPISYHWLREIVAGRKRHEYRAGTVWDRRLAGRKPPFTLRLIGGYRRPMPEIMVEVRAAKRSPDGEWDMSLGPIISSANLDRLAQSG